MARTDYSTAVESLLGGRTEVSTKEFFEAMPGCPAQTVYSRIRALEKQGRIYASGHGVFTVGSRMRYVVEITPWMVEVNRYLVSECEGAGHCISERGGNLHVEVYRPDVRRVMEALKARYRHVAGQDEAGRITGLTGYVIVGHIISEAPLLEEGEVPVPSLEKSLVDMIAERKCPEEEVQKHFQRAFEVYQINSSTLLRYASRRNVRPQAARHIGLLNRERIEMIGKIQEFFATQPVERAWLFGSFSRQEERPDSDVDLLVDYQNSKKLSLLDISRIMTRLQTAISREIDLVENGYLMPFAENSVNNDKYLIYERTTQRPRTA